MKQALRVLAILVLASCSRPQPEPAGLLPREKFKSTLLGSQLIEARLNHEMVNDKRLDMPVREYYAELFKAEGVSEQAFKTTFQWYVEHPADLKVIYEEILVELQKRADKPVAAIAH